MNELATTHTPVAIDSIDQMENVSKKLAASGLMGKGTTPEMVFGLMMLCQSEGIHPITAMKRYHIVEGRPSMRADAMQAEFIAHGGSIIFHVRTDEMVSATFFRSKELLSEDSQSRAASRFEKMWTLDATEEPEKRGKLMVDIAKLSRDGEETIIRTFLDCAAKGITQGRDGIKANWKTSPRQMLTARVITEGVRLVNPGLIAGIYNEDETADIVRQEREAQRKMLDAPTVQDADSIRQIIEGYDEELKGAATDSRRKVLLGLRAELVCKLGDLGVDVPAVALPAASVVQGHTVTNVTPVEVPKPQPVEQQQAPQKPAVQDLTPAAKVVWQDVVCHVGGATAKGKTLGNLFDSKRSEKAMKSIAKFFDDWALEENLNSLNAEDKAKMPALLAAAKTGYAAWKKAQEPAKEPESTTTPPAASEAPQEAVASSDWREFLIESKDAAFNGKKMGQLSAQQMERIGDYLAKVDMANATPYQRKLAAMYALATASGPVLEIPAHVKELDAALRKHNIDPERFLVEMRAVDAIGANCMAMADITEPEAKAMFNNWQSVVDACTAIDA